MNGIEFECCNGTCNQGRNCPMREERAVHGSGIVLAVVFVAGCAAIALLLAKFIP